MQRLAPPCDDRRDADPDAVASNAPQTQPESIPTAADKPRYATGTSAAGRACAGAAAGIATRHVTSRGCLAALHAHDRIPAACLADRLARQGPRPPGAGALGPAG